MKEFDELIAVADQLNDPKTGCPWDLQQTFSSLQKYLLEETCELLDAVDHKQLDNIIEELGDVLYIIIFYCKIGEREGTFTLEEVINILKEKMIRRHPHIFGEEKSHSLEEIVSAWKKVKQEEKKERKNALEGIPKSLTALARGQKIFSKLIELDYPELSKMTHKPLDETTLGEEMIQLILRAEHQGLDAESILRKALGKYEKVLSQTRPA